MARVTIEDSLQHVNDQFALVHLTAKRYRELHRGAKRLVDCKNKDIIAALREIASGKVTFREDVQEILLKTKQHQVAPARGGEELVADPIEELEATPLI